MIRTTAPIWAGIPGGRTGHLCTPAASEGGKGHGHHVKMASDWETEVLKNHCRKEQVIWGMMSAGQELELMPQLPQPTLSTSKFLIKMSSSSSSIIITIAAMPSHCERRMTLRIGGLNQNQSLKLNKNFMNTSLVNRNAPSRSDKQMQKEISGLSRNQCCKSYGEWDRTILLPPHHHSHPQHFQK